MEFSYKCHDDVREQNNIGISAEGDHLSFSCYETKKNESGEFENQPCNFFMSNSFFKRFLVKLESYSNEVVLSIKNFKDGSTGQLTIEELKKVMNKHPFLIMDYELDKIVFNESVDERHKEELKDSIIFDFATISGNAEFREGDCEFWINNGGVGKNVFYTPTINNPVKIKDIVEKVGLFKIKSKDEDNVDGNEGM